MREIRTVLRWLKKSYLSLFITLVLLVVLTYTRTIVPQFIAFTTDAILLNNSSTFPKILGDYILSFNTDAKQLIVLGIMLVIFQIFRAALMYLRRFTGVFYTENTMYKLRNQMFYRLQRLSISYYKERNLGEILQKTSTDLDAVRNFIGNEITEIIWCILIVSFLLFQMTKINITYMLISVALLPIIFLSSFFYTKRITPVFTKFDETESELLDMIGENVSGVAVVKAFGTQNIEQAKYFAKADAYYNQLVYMFKKMATYFGTIELLTYAQITITVFVGVYFISRSQISIGDYILMLLYTSQTSGPLRALGRLLSRVGRNIVAVRRIDEILQEEPEDISGIEVDLSSTIEFDKVSFCYPDGNINVLNEISFKIENGQRVGILGRSGSGKSTLSLLLARLYDPTSGTIRINDVDITKISRKYLRDNIGILIQEPYLFSKSVYENIGMSTKEYNQSDVEFFANVASVHDDIMEFEDGYKTEIGEKGVTLSGGQKQRIAIARMLLSKKNILVFDDSLSAVDLRTDASIRNELAKEVDTTTLIITHRVASILDCDLIIYLDDGKIVETGHPNELLNKESLFKQLYTKQVGGEI